MALLPGSVLDSRYRIVRAIKAGGMGAVYEVVDTRLNDAVCALKEMHEFSESDTATFIRTKFEEEKRLLASLTHAGIPRVRDFFVRESTCYIVMDLVRGTNLEQEFKEHGAPYAPEKVVEIGLQVLDVLTYLHGQHPPLVHRDVKPANLIRHADSGRVWLVDFGLAFSYTGVSRTEVGTLGYAPIEQIKGKAEPRSDLYALGATLHYFLTGKFPVPLSMPGVLEVAPTADRALAAIIDRAVAEKPEDRYANATQMSMALQGWSAGGAPAPGPVHNQRSWVPVAILAAVVLMGLASLLPGHQGSAVAAATPSETTIASPEPVESETSSALPFPDLPHQKNAPWWLTGTVDAVPAGAEKKVDDCSLFLPEGWVEVNDREENGIHYAIATAKDHTLARIDWFYLPKPERPLRHRNQLFRTRKWGELIHAVPVAYHPGLPAYSDLKGTDTYAQAIYMRPDGMRGRRALIAHIRTSDPKAWPFAQLRAIAERFQVPAL